MEKILKSSATLNEIDKNAGIRPYLRFTEIGEIRLLEDGYKRLLENSPTDSISVSKNSETIVKVFKSSGTPTKVSKNASSLTKILKS